MLVFRAGSPSPKKRAGCRSSDNKKKGGHCGIYAVFRSACQNCGGGGSSPPKKRDGLCALLVMRLGGGGFGYGLDRMVQTARGVAVATRVRRGFARGMQPPLE